MDRPRKVSYRTGLFDPSNLTSPSEIDSTLLEFAAVINRTNYAEVLNDLFEKKNIVVLVLSGIHEEIPLKEWILDDFPSNPNSFENSLASGLLRELCAFFLFYCSSADAETASFLRRHNHYVHHGSEILRILQNLPFVEEANDERLAFPPSPTRKRGKVSQREQKQARKLVRESLSIDHKPFTALHITVPTKRGEADSLSKVVWMKIGAILDVLLSGIRRPEIIDVIHSLFIPQESPEEQAFANQPVILVEESVLSPPPPQAAEEVPPLYPVVRPMAMALYFDPPDDFGKWRILLGSPAERDLRHWERRDNKIFLIIMKKLKDLSCGFFSNDNQKRLCGPNTDVPVFEAKMTRDLRLVYSVDCITDYDNKSEIQALRVYGIFTHSQMDYRLWECVCRYLSSHNKEYRERCLARRPHPDGGNIYLPQSFPESSQVEEPVEFNPRLPADNVNQLHHIISLEKYVMLSKGLLESIETNKDANFPFEVSKKERAIIEYPHSCYVLGRSGTGKTTTMLFKILVIERDYQLSEKLRQRPRQMFVTQSRALVAKVEELFMVYLSSLAFVSHEDGPVARRNINISDGDDIFNAEDNTEWRNDLPDKFSELEDRHFPLFIAFDTLCTMIEADIQATSTPESVGSSSSPRPVIEFLENACSARKGQLVTYDRFVAEYWSRFEHSRFHPLLIFNEIMGVIAGSEGSLLSPNGYMDREVYIDLSPRMYPVFSEHRETIYGVFVSYLKRKRELDDYDSTDRTHAIIRSVVKKTLALRKVSHLYVDETQDNLLIDVFLLRLLCGNSDGLFWAGDTAQTISAGSSFRFNDLKAFLYRLQKRRLDQEMLSPMRLREPKMFFLAVNYRSHAGIVNCAHSIVEIINKYWKNSIDSLPRERGNAHGAMPIFYTNIYPEFVRKGHFLSRDRILDGEIKLGADQCILVRDENARDRLKREVGHDMFEKLGIVITLYDSKGQEFDDVFLYNFFHDSLVDNAWRLMLNDVSHDGLTQSRIAAPQFDKARHGTLCSELKALYVAITRARNNLRIADESFIGEPTRAFWESRGQILSCRPGQESTDFARPSDEERWANRGKRFFDDCQWEHAKQCYKRAGKKQAESVADAYLQRERARRIPSEGKGKARKSAFMSAAKAFESCSQNANDPLATNKYLKLFAGCLEEGNETRRAAEVYRQGNWVSDAARLYRKLGLFDEIFDIITQSDASLVATIPESIRDVTRLHFVSKEAYEKARRLFNSVEEELDYLEDRSLHDAQVSFFVRHGQIREAADLHLSEGRPLEALDLYLQDTTDVPYSLSKAKEITLDNLWQLSPFGVTPIEHGKMRRLLEHAKNLIRAGVMDDNDNDEITMFRTILDGPQKKFSELANSFLKRGNKQAAVLSYDHYFEHLPSLLGQDIQKIAFDLHQFSDYVHTLRDFVFLDNPTSNPRTRNLFGIQIGEEKGTIGLSKPNILFQSSSYLAEKGLDSKGNLLLSQRDFLTALRQCLRTRLLDRVTRENVICHKSQALHQPPCVHHIIFKNCDSSPCDFSHISPDFIWFKHWIKAHLLQIEIYNSISGIQYPREFRVQQGFWLIKLYEALNPAHHDFAPTSSMMDINVVALPRAANVLIEWVRAVSFELDFHPGFRFLTFAMQTADFAFAYDRKEAEIYMSRCKFVTSFCPPEFYRKPHVNSLQEMLMSWNHKNISHLSMGIQFICHVLERRIPVNIHVFCSFIERVCSMLIVCHHLQRKGNLHRIILPRTWLKASLDSIDVEDAKRQNKIPFWSLLQPLEEFIHILYFPPAPGKFQFKYGPQFHTLETRGLIIRGLFVARMCRVLGLLGSNILVDQYQFGNQILNIFTTLHQELSHQDLDPKISSLYKRYFTARTFKGVYFATCESMRRAVFDEMVRLLYYPEQLDATRPNREPEVRDIVYSTHGELLSLLDTMQHLHTPDVSSSCVEPDDGSLLGDEVDEHDDDQELGVSNESDEVALEIHELPPDSDIPEGVYTGHSEQDDHAAYVIQRVWSKHLDRKRDMMKAGQEASARQLFVNYRNALLPAMRRSSPRYSIFFLGPLPSLQAALESIQPELHRAKEFLKKKLGPHGNHEDLDEVNANLTRINKVIKNLRRHQGQLKPDSVLHSNCNIDQLKKEVKDVFNIVDDIRPLLKMSNGLQEAFEIAYKAVLQDHKPQVFLPTPVAKEGRPRLVIEDLQELIQDAHEDI